MSKKKLTNSEKKKINSVIKKWNPSFFNRNFNKAMAPTSGLLGALFLTDAFLTAGSVSMIYAGLSGILFARSSRNLQQGYLGLEWNNNSAQKIKSTVPVKFVLQRMEADARSLFNQLAKDGLKENQEKNKRIISSMNAIKNDIDTIRPLFLVDGVSSDDFEVYLHDKHSKIPKPINKLTEAEFREYVFDSQSFEEIVKSDGLIKKKLKKGGFGT